MDMLKFYKNIRNTATFSNLSSNVKFCYDSNLSLPTWCLPRQILVEVTHWKFCQTTVEQKQENIPVGHPVTHTPSSYTPAHFLLTVRTSVATRCQHSGKVVLHWTSLNRSLGMVTRCHQQEGGAFRRGSARAMAIKFRSRIAYSTLKVHSHNQQKRKRKRNGFRNLWIVYFELL